MVEGLFMVETSRGCFDRAVGAGPIRDNEAFEVPFLLKNVGEQVFIFASKLAVDGVVGAHDRAWFGDFNADLERQQIRFPHGPPADDSAHLIPSAFLIVYGVRSEEHTSELQSLTNLVCRLLLEKKKQ